MVCELGAAIVPGTRPPVARAASAPGEVRVRSEAWPEEPGGGAPGTAAARHALRFAASERAEARPRGRPRGGATERRDGPVVGLFR